MVGRRECPWIALTVGLPLLRGNARPDLAAAAIRTAIKPDGAWFIVDVECGETLEENLKNPLGAFLYSASIGMCLQSSASQVDGMQLGTAGLPEPRMRELVTAAGFSSFERVPGLQNPLNAYYLARP